MGLGISADSKFYCQERTMTTMSMKRVYSTYTEEQFKTLKEEAEKRNMTLSNYQLYLVLLALPEIESDGTNLVQLSNDMFCNLNAMEPGVPFIISSLFTADTWASLNAKEKKALAMQLSHHVRNHPNEYERIGVLPGKITQYQRRKEL